MARSHKPGASPPAAASTSATTSPDRRNILWSILAALVGGVVSLVPLAAGLVSFLDPLFKRKSAGGAAKGPVLRVAMVDAIPSDGTPIQVPVISDLVDGWNREPNQPIGAVFLRKEGDQIQCFSAICPHAGCRVGFSAERGIFQCPCHTSAFQLNGSREMPSPSPRDMDSLEIDAEKLKAGEVWVEYVNYYPGKDHKEPKT